MGPMARMHQFLWGDGEMFENEEAVIYLTSY